MNDAHINKSVACPKCGETREIGDLASYAPKQIIGDTYAYVYEGNNLYCMKCKHEWNHANE